ncbi:NADPH-dependent 2,4-dienoyl-CoA reductase/sulfur reductase [Desulfuromonas soudanensis]|uniref:NADPH-dependent 2,4-dienoyl-CoA reductase/sulfur reductase n=1 Tax=Desulfuromonas soudanensis TaxID=1603606 RepID=A0A0M4D4W0_9BACT|nr:FAD-dependent oxidoreductase [Desulfuromonas soudanensis]ALC17776.1 NADPH-dependent 2,4-dienoyl-CoA reductase/sulfur reductase [Desulfuromonas soudanensis]
MAKKRLIVIGGDAAGMSAAAKARRLDADLGITVFERSPHTSYSACGMPYYIAGMVEKVEDLISRTPEVFRDKYSIDARILHEVTAIDPAAGRVQVVDRQSRKESWEPYDQLLIATGALPFCPELPGSDARGIFGLSTLQSGIRVRRALDEEKPRRAVVVGGGYIGLEMAEALIRRGLEVSLIQRGPQVMETLDAKMGALISEALREIGVQLYLEESLTGFEVQDGRVTAAVTTNRTLPADIVILGMGTRPNTALAAAAGIPLGVKGALKVNARMQTETSGIWGAGDCAESFHLVSREPVHIALGTIANKQGTVAGTNLGDGYATFPGVVGTAVSKICKYEVARTGLQERDLLRLGLQYDTATIKSRTRAGYYPGAGHITVKLLAEKGSGRLLGGQIVGLEGAAKRIDILATALHAGMTVQQIVDLDLSYAPPFSPVWDPVQTAARQLI